MTLPAAETLDVSVLVPAKDEAANLPEFLRLCAEALAPAGFSYEVVVVNDGSRGDSVALAHDYARQHPERIHYLEHEGARNRGHSASRNLAVRHARGEYLAFLDDDACAHAGWRRTRPGRRAAVASRIP